MNLFDRKKTPVLAVGISVALLMTGLPQSAFALNGVDDSTATGVFQMEGNATKDAAICFGTDEAGQPATAAVGSYPTNNSGGTSECPTLGNFQKLTFGTNGGVTVPEDWSNIYSNSGNFTARSFEGDPINTSNDDAFLGEGQGGKDPNDIDQWTYDNHKPQGKDDIGHAYAASYILNNGHTAVYLGMDRYANSGDIAAGWWLVQDSAFDICTAEGQGSRGPNAGCLSGGTFAGHHTNGDVLIVSDFTTGGAVGTINVFIWNNGLPNTPDGNFSPAPCNPVSDNSTHCGLVSNGYTQVLNRRGNPVLQPALVPTGGWTFGDKDGNSSFAHGEFIEVGIDLNEIFQGAPPCFSTFMGETRSSTSVSASRSDLTAPVSFPLCSFSVTKQCTGSSIVTLTGANCRTGEVCDGSQVVRYTFSGNITNTGAQTIYNANLTDTPPSTEYVANSLTINGSSATPGTAVLLANTTSANGGVVGNQTKTYSGTFDSTAVLGTDVHNSISVKASSDSSGTPQNIGPETANWGNPNVTGCKPPVAPGLTETKLCKTCLVSNSDLHVEVKDAVKICNTGNVAISGITIKDCRSGQWSANPSNGPLNTCSGTEATLGSGISLGPQVGSTPTCTVVNSPTTFAPTSCDSTTGQNCSFSDQVIASGTAAFGGGTVYADGGAATSATCSVCPVNTDDCPNFVDSDFQ